MGKWRAFLYISALFLIVIPISIVLMTDDPFRSIFSNLVISLAIILVILGKSITVVEKRKESKRFAPDIGAIIGLSIVLIIGFIQ
ncbi:histidine kinase [Aquibacillus rhizosphaerae]|uniref:Histidine kinase n=1 Tax=Aquibacillus rhizosphaerae TaxID=3051431 RepID=A0ABT7L944_9BACI|nr:histidine kinase [Aquibacillus sp. LR5S19]MDL4842388.1 histidine kinase [Aquibacillus sp. LR5S19]